ncbi:hypothetical protein [uncultured Aquimarina sp.]|uniref:hypothetical protein n=1 Tax=uncultured Aquimarina sp. TaxID=575652 RepID=UPI0026222A0E|nr:hypothetical protein [uncultured Aquimarina sp.]
MWCIEPELTENEKYPKNRTKYLMDLARHCNLCDNQKTSLKFGTTCGLTDRKPEFNKTCTKIELNEKFENKLKSVNIEYDKVKKRKNLKYLYSGIFILIGLAFIIYGYLLGMYVLDDIDHTFYIDYFHITIMGIGLLPFGIAYKMLREYKQEFDLVKSNKDKIDEVLNEYKIDYYIDIKYGKKIHGTQKVFAELKIME